MYLIVEAGGQGTEQGFKEWVDGGNLISVCSCIRSSCVLKEGKLLGVLLISLISGFGGMTQEWSQNMSQNYLRGKAGENNLGILLC